jgi:hypothetical protein
MTEGCKRYQTILVSDGGEKMHAEAEPKGDWARPAIRINEIVGNQVRSLPRQVIASFQSGTRRGTYWACGRTSTTISPALSPARRTRRWCWQTPRLA